MARPHLFVDYHSLAFESTYPAILKSNTGSNRPKGGRHIYIVTQPEHSKVQLFLKLGPIESKTQLPHFGCDRAYKDPLGLSLEVVRSKLMKGPRRPRRCSDSDHCVINLISIR